MFPRHPQYFLVSGHSFQHFFHGVFPKGDHALGFGFGPDAFQPMVDLFLERYLTMETGVTREELFAAQKLGDPEECKQVAEAAGLVDVVIEAKDMGYQIKGADDWWEVVWNAGLRGFLNKLPQDKLGKFKMEHFKEVTEVMGNNPFLNIETHFVTGKKPV